MPDTPQHYKSFIAETKTDAIVAEIEAEILKRNNGKRSAYSEHMLFLAIESETQYI